MQVWSSWLPCAARKPLVAGDWQADMYTCAGLSALELLYNVSLGPADMAHGCHCMKAITGRSLEAAGAAVACYDSKRCCLRVYFEDAHLS